MLCVLFKESRSKSQDFFRQIVFAGSPQGIYGTHSIRHG